MNSTGPESHRAKKQRDQKSTFWESWFREPKILQFDNRICESQELDQIFPRNQIFADQKCTGPGFADQYIHGPLFHRPNYDGDRIPYSKVLVQSQSKHLSGPKRYPKSKSNSMPWVSCRHRVPSDIEFPNLPGKWEWRPPCAAKRNAAQCHRIPGYAGTLRVVSLCRAGRYSVG